MIDASHRRGVAHGPLLTLPSLLVLAVDATETDLIELDRDPATRGGLFQIFLGCLKDFNLLPDEDVKRAENRGIFDR